MPSSGCSSSDGVIAISVMPTTPIAAKLEKIVQYYGASVERPIEVRIVVAGSSELLHSFICSYTSLLQV